MTSVQRIKWAIVMWFALAICSACAVFSARHLKHVQEAAEVAAESLECVDRTLEERDAEDEDGRPNEDAPKPDVGE